MYKSFGPGALGISVSFEESARLGAAAGFDGLQVDAELCLTAGPQAVKDVLSANGLRPGTIGLPVAFAGEEAAYEKGLADLAAKVRAASEVGCTRCSTYILSWSTERDFQENFGFHVRRMKEPARILADHGMRLGLEFLGPKTLRVGQRHEFIHTIEGMLDLCLAIGTGNVGLLLDCWHWHTSGGSLDSLRSLRDEHVVDVHLNDAPAGIPTDQLQDNVRCLPGETGVIDVGSFLRHLVAIGYTGPAMVEPFSQEVREMPPEAAARAAAQSIAAVWKLAGLGE